MKVLFFSSDNSYSSGSFISMANLAKILKDSGVQVKIILPFEGDGERLLNELGVCFTTINMNSWIVPINRFRVIAYIKCIIGLIQNELFYQNRIKKEIESFNPDIVHMNGLWGYLGAYVADRLNIPIVWHIREFLEEDQYRKIIFKHNGYKLVSKSAYIICISKAIKEKYSTLLECNKIEVIYNGIDINKYIYSDHKLFTSSETRGVIIGGISRGKGQYRAVKALSKNDISVFNLSIVGGLNGINKLVWPIVLWLNPNKRVKYMGRKYDVSDILHKSDICIISSKCEAWGRVTVEAMLSGCVVIGANTGATPEIINNGRNGYLYDYQKNNLLQTINMVLMNKDEAKRVARKGQLDAIERYGADKNANSIIQIYKMMRE